MPFSLRNFYEFADLAAFDRGPQGQLQQASGTPTTAIAGLFATIDSSFAVVSRRDASIELRIDDKAWDLDNPAVTLDYVRNDDETTTFSVWRDDNPDYSRTYKSWWVDQPESLDPIVGAPRDEEMDFFAYVFELWQSDRIRRNLARSWADSDQGAPAAP